MACTKDCAGRKVVCTCPRDDQQEKDKKAGWPKPDPPKPYYPKERKK